MTDFIKKIKCLIYSHDWKYVKKAHAYKAVYKCGRCGKRCEL